LPHTSFPASGRRLRLGNDGAASGPACDWREEQLFERRIVLVTGQLDDHTAAKAAAALLTLEARADRPIDLPLDSPDGALGAAFVLIDTADTLRSALRVLCRDQIRGNRCDRGRRS
jgi:ATP-dependent protease ClpP protease subunit